jgi:predicted transglutaminase-like cysteine proteinase
MRTRWVVVMVGIGLAGTPLTAVAKDVPTQLASLPLQPIVSAPSPEQSTPITRLDQLAHTYTTPKAIATFLRTEFTFRRDEELFGEADHWQSPQEFVARQVGDCEDYALLAQALLRRNGIEAYVFSLFGEDGYAHTVAAFRDERGRYNVINQGDIRYYRATSLEALAWQLSPTWTRGMIAEQDGTRGRMVREFFNDQPAPLLADDFGSVPF